MNAMYGFVQMQRLLFLTFFLFLCEISKVVTVKTKGVRKDWLDLENLNSSFIWEIRALIISGKKKNNLLLRIYRTFIARPIRNHDVRHHL